MAVGRKDGLGGVGTRADQCGKNDGKRIGRKGNLERGRTGGEGDVFNGVADPVRAIAVAGGRGIVVVVREHMNRRPLQIAMQHGRQPEGQHQQGERTGEKSHGATIPSRAVLSSGRADQN